MTNRKGRADKEKAQQARSGRRRGTGGRGPVRGRKEPVPLILVVAEGKTTEPAYLTWLNKRCTAVSIKCQFNHSAPEHVVARAIQQKKRGPSGVGDDVGTEYQAVWCMVDTDIHARLAKAVADAKRAGIEVAVSSRCFETWLLMHLRDETRPYATSKDEKRAWRDLVGPHHADAPQQFNLIADRLPDALARARRKRTQDDRDGKRRFERNPSSEVDGFIRAVAELADVDENKLYGG